MKLSQDITPAEVDTTVSQVAQWALALRQLHARIALTLPVPNHANEYCVTCKAC